MKTRQYVFDWARIANNTQGNPCYTIHYSCISDDYGIAVQVANLAGGHKYDTHDFEDGVIFSSYDLIETERDIAMALEELKVINIRLVMYDEVMARLEKTKMRKNTVAYRLVRNAIQYDTKMRPNYILGSGKYTKVSNHKQAVISLLDEIHLDYVVGNDAPRGGQCGEFIQICTKIIK